MRGHAKVITVNTSFRAAPWADVHYSSDIDWWREYLDEMRATCSGELWTGDPAFCDNGMRCARFDKKMHGVSQIPGVLAWGGNSGYCAVGLAYQFGGRRIILLGYDMKGDGPAAHFHGAHPPHVQRDFNWPMWRQRFDEMAQDFRDLGVEVINCTRDTALTCFPQKTLKEALKC